MRLRLASDHRQGVSMALEMQMDQLLHRMEIQRELRLRLERRKPAFADSRVAYAQALREQCGSEALRSIEEQWSGMVQSAIAALPAAARGPELA